MPQNTKTEHCIKADRGALVFWSPEEGQRKPSTKVQIIDVVDLQVATGYTRDSQGRLLLEAHGSASAGRSWSWAKAAQLIRNDARPHRWVALQLDKRAWGLFWAGGGLQRCRELLADRLNEAETCTALVPATPEALLLRLLDLEADTEEAIAPQQLSTRPAIGPWIAGQPNPWKLMAWTSLAWLAVLGITVAGFLVVLERQDRKLELLLQRTAPASGPVKLLRP
jgi:hypothetical protein